MKGLILIKVNSTKDKIKAEAQALFARKGYFGTSISDITKAVGITKSSLYSHYAGKDALFSAIFEEVAAKHGELFGQLAKEASDLELKEQLKYHFVEYIRFFYRNREIQSLSNQSLFHVPPELGEKLRNNYLVWEMPYRKILEEVFARGMQDGIIRKGDPSMKVWSFKAKRDGVLGWICASPVLNENSIKEFWDDYWFGVVEKTNDINDTSGTMDTRQLPH